MFESIISAERVEKLPFPQNLRISSWSYDVDGHAKKCVERYCGLAKKHPSNCTKLKLHALMTINSKKRNWESVGELTKVCSQIVLKCLYLARIGRPDILWSVNKLARAVKWTRACDKRLARLISHIHHSRDFTQY